MEVSQKSGSIHWIGTSWKMAKWPTGVRDLCTWIEYHVKLIKCHFHRYYLLSSSPDKFFSASTFIKQGKCFSFSACCLLVPLSENMLYSQLAATYYCLTFSLLYQRWEVLFCQLLTALLISLWTTIDTQSVLYSYCVFNSHHIYGFVSC